MLDQNVAGHSTTQCRDHCQAKHADEVEFVGWMPLGNKGSAEGTGGDAGEV